LVGEGLIREGEGAEVWSRAEGVKLITPASAQRTRRPLKRRRWGEASVAPEALRHAQNKLSLRVAEVVIGRPAAWCAEVEGEGDVWGEASELSRGDLCRGRRAHEHRELRARRHEAEHERGTPIV
jgi:hypothetical protein